MIKNIFKIIFVILAVLSLQSSPAFAQSMEWVKSYGEALKKADSEKKPILADFSTSWCGWCKKMEKETFTNPRVVERSAQFVCVKINGDTESGLVSKYNVRGFPTLVFLDSKETILGGGPGYRDVERLLSEMDAVLAKVKNRYGPKAIIFKNRRR